MLPRSSRPLHPRNGRLGTEGEPRITHRLFDNPTIAALESGTWGTKAKPLAVGTRWRLCCLSSTATKTPLEDDHAPHMLSWSDWGAFSFTPVRLPQTVPPQSIDWGKAKPPVPARLAALLSVAQRAVAHFPSRAASIMACQPSLIAPGAPIQASIISSVGSRIAAMAARARAKDDAGSSNGAVPISCWSACATRLSMVLIDLAPPLN